PVGISGWLVAALPKNIVLVPRSLRFFLKIKGRCVWKWRYSSYLCIPQTRYCGLFIEFWGLFSMFLSGRIWCIFFGFYFAMTGKALIFAARHFGGFAGDEGCEKK